MRIKRCILCDHSFQADESEHSGGICLDGECKVEITDCYALDHSKLCEWCNQKKPEQIIKKLKTLGIMK